MVGADITAARETLGHRWGLGRALKPAELGRAMRIDRRDPGRSIISYEEGAKIPGEVEVCILLFLAGAEPPDSISDIVRLKGRVSKDKTP